MIGPGDGDDLSVRQVLGQCHRAGALLQHRAGEPDEVRFPHRGIEVGVEADWRSPPAVRRIGAGRTRPPQRHPAGIAEGGDLGAGVREQRHLRTFGKAEARQQTRLRTAAEHGHAIESGRGRCGSGVAAHECVRERLELRIRHRGRLSLATSGPEPKRSLGLSPPPRSGHRGFRRDRRGGAGSHEPRAPPRPCWPRPRRRRWPP